MRLLQRRDTGTFFLTADFSSEDTIPPYAILSHTWGADAEEVTFEDLKTGRGKDKPGYTKILFCGEQVQQDGLQYFWIDTCCINKENKAELAHAIKSMFRWYRHAMRCYVYMSDVSCTGPGADKEICPPPWISEFRKSKWFARGWTLQELLAPNAVEFFSRDMKRLGNKISLAQEIHEITGIPHRALQGATLSQFTVDERLSWKGHRRTTLQEDGAYSLLGIFDVYLARLYGEGAEGAFRRLLDEIGKLKQCIRDVRITDPRDDKKRIEATKGGLLEGSYSWALNTISFQRWREDPQSRLLWVKGDPGKGKTMLLCGVIDELQKSSPVLISFFFCQGTNSQINNATAVLRGLIYFLISQQPSLATHLRKKHDQAGRSAFEDANSWVVLVDIFSNLVQDPDLKMAYLVVDALDECVLDLPKLLDLFIRTSTSSSRIKWLLSSRNEMHIEQKLRCVDDNARLNLELKQNAEQVSQAVDLYIDDKLSRLESLQERSLRDQVRDILRHKADGTFLWVALVVQELEDPESWEPLQVVEEIPSGLHPLYSRMMDQIVRLKQRNSERCNRLLSTACTAYRPLSLPEMHSLCALEDHVSIRSIVSMCGSFLAVRDDQIYLVHQSAKDYLRDKASQGGAHYGMFSQSLRLMSSVLKRDMYNLGAPGFPIDKVQMPVQNALAAARYSCVYWVNHLCDSASYNSTECDESLHDDGAVLIFLKERYLYWLEALSLCHSVPSGVTSITKLQYLVQGRANATALSRLLQDARRFIMYHKAGIENYPLQTYASALLFSPTGSLVKKLFQHELHAGITVKTAIAEDWGESLQILEGHSRGITSVAFSPDSARLASASLDGTAKVWDASNGMCLQTLESHSKGVMSVAFSHDSTRLASGSSDRTVKIWDASSGACLQTLTAHRGVVLSVAFSHDSTRLASTSSDETIKLWDVSSGVRLCTLNGHDEEISSVAFSHDSVWLASASRDSTVRIRNVIGGACLWVLQHDQFAIYSVAFSHDSSQLASTLNKSIIIWDPIRGSRLKRLVGHADAVSSVVFFHNSTWLASGSYDRTVRIWDTSSGSCLKILEGHIYIIKSIAVSHDSVWLVSASSGNTVKIWDASSGTRAQLPGGHSDLVTLVAFSYDSALLASGSNDRTVRVWDASSGICLHTLRGHGRVIAMAFSYDSAWLASASYDKEVIIWDARTGVCLQKLKGLSNSVFSVAFPYERTRLVSLSWDGMAKLWDTRTGACVRTLRCHNKSAGIVSFSLNSAWLASASMESKSVSIWDASHGAKFQKLKGHTKQVTSIAFSRDSAWLASASIDKTLKIWDVRSGACLQTFDTDSLVLQLVFDITNVKLYSNIGTIEINTPLDVDSTSSVHPRRPHYSGLSLSAGSVWIQHNSKNLVWIPSEYRPLYLTMFRESMAIAVGKRVWICNVEPRRDQNEKTELAVRGKSAS